MPATVSIRAELSPSADAAISAFADALDGLGKRVDLPLHFVERLAKLSGIDIETLLTCRAVQGGVALEPSDRLLQLVAAVRAGDIDAL